MAKSPARTNKATPPKATATKPAEVERKPAPEADAAKPPADDGNGTLTQVAADTVDAAAGDDSLQGDAGADSLTGDQVGDVAELISGEADSVVETFERQVIGDRDETRVIPHDHAPIIGAEARQPTLAEIQALHDHAEVRASELVSFCRAEASKLGCEPYAIADLVMRRLHDALTPNDEV